ncbi:MAG: zinc ribbon domain-containing protein [Verrucomicrobiae bacterium]|nr:zinc ribbon domain-containing protein [Verrucomicrobiae bacterium]NNJ86913.1 zinc ribbon domain-containing protein [Akkermansiaceae bacterium]
MPNYDYQCQECGHIFEVFQKMSDAKLEDCQQEKCSGKVRRLLGTGAGVIFKGSGFYQTDYRSESYKKDASKDSGAKKTTESAPTKKNEGGHACGTGCGCN